MASAWELLQQEQERRRALLGDPDVRSASLIGPEDQVAPEVEGSPEIPLEEQNSSDISLFDEPSEISVENTPTAQKLSAQRLLAPEEDLAPPLKAAEAISQPPPPSEEPNRRALLGGMGRVSQALYHATAREKLPDTYFARGQKDFDLASGTDDKSKILEWLKFKEQQRSNRFNENYKTSGQEALNNQRGISNALREAGLGQGDTRIGQGQQRLDQKALMDQHKIQQDQITQERNDLNLGLNLAKARQAHVEKINSALVGYGKLIKDIDPMVASLKTIEQLAPGLTKNTLDEGGLADNALGSWDKVLQNKYLFGIGQRITPPDEAKLQAAVNSFRANLLKAISGGQVTGPEFERWERMSGVAAGAPASVQAAFLDVMRQEIYENLKAKEASFQNIPETDWQTAAQRGATNSRLTLFDDLRIRDEAKRRKAGLPEPTPVQATDPYAEVGEGLSTHTQGQLGNSVMPTQAPQNPASPTQPPTTITDEETGQEPTNSGLTPRRPMVAPTGGLQKIYHPETDKTYVFDNGVYVDFDEGDTTNE